MTEFLNSLVIPIWITLYALCVIASFGYGVLVRKNVPIDLLYVSAMAIAWSYLAFGVLIGETVSGREGAAFAAIGVLGLGTGATLMGIAIGRLLRRLKMKR